MVKESSFTELVASFFSQGRAPYNANSSIRFGNAIKQCAKLLFALFAYCFANVVLAVCFSGARLCPVVIFQTINSGLRLFLSQLFSLIGYFISNYGVYTFWTLAYIVRLYFSVFVWAGLFFVTVIVAGRIFLCATKQRSVSHVFACSYAQHIQFLS